ncbi:hypothetical protein M231_04034 [Tremella mesenterica]|uniref:Methyltransferase type 11 domain-containing protein n=1 Tax=Tremella mesenterica TaxID=5217 RepID=A0A4Q1BLR3_TREME|nr:hypothetical protein M231_04034 [Tremella mesenterica]
MAFHSDDEMDLDEHAEWDSFPNVEAGPSRSGTSENMVQAYQTQYPWEGRDFDNLQSYVYPPRRPTTPSSSISEFSLHSSVEMRVFREDNGRIYQANNDDYVLPADQAEMNRLEYQHYGLKARQGDKNYLAPFPMVLQGDDKRLLDIGTGTGIWAIEMALEFPHVEVLGMDLAPVQRTEGVPDNCHFQVDDAALGLPFSDGYFDAVHARLVIIGIRNWKSLIQEVIRVTKPGGLVVFVEMDALLTMDGIPRDEQRIRAPGFTKFSDYLERAIGTRGLDVIAGGTTIPRLLSQQPILGQNRCYASLPMWPWSNDPILRKTGEIIYGDSLEIPETCRLMIVDACGLSMQEYDNLKDGFLGDLGRPGAEMTIPIWHNWAFKSL